MNQIFNFLILSCLIFSSIQQTDEDILKEQLLRDISNSKNTVNDWPVIGIYTVPSTYPEKYPTDQYSTIDASYVNFIQFAGAQVVPIYHTSTQQELDTMFSQINGLLFTGGDVDIVGSNNKWTPFAQNALYLLRLAITANDKGDYFPVWGTCLGFQLITSVISGDKDLLVFVNNTNVSENITFINRSQSIIFNELPQDLVTYSETNSPYFFDHHWGVPVDKWYVTPQLLSFFNITAIGYAPKTNITFVAGIQGKKYPIFGSQFHPEKEQFIWLEGLNIDHTFESIQISQYIANKFVNLARQNLHSFSSLTEFQKWSSYNWKWIQYPIESDMASFFYEIGNSSGSNGSFE